MSGKHITYQTFPIPDDVQTAITEALERGRVAAEIERFQKRSQEMFVWGLLIGLAVGVVAGLAAPYLRLL